MLNGWVWEDGACYYCDDKSFVQLLHDRLGTVGDGGIGDGWLGIEGARRLFGC